MAKPIPVFEFAFAAYAATVQAGVDKPIGEVERRPFEAIWRSMADRDGALLVKIGVLDNGRAVVALSLCGSAPPVKEIWLGQVKETADGYSGAVCMTQMALHSIKSRQRIEFRPSHILDWTISYGTPTQCAALRRRSKSAPAACEPCGECKFAEEARG